MSQLRYWRQYRGYSQRQLGKFVGVTGNAVSQYERGVAKPRVQICKSLAQVLDVEFDVLFQSFYDFSVTESATSRIAPAAK